MRKLTNLVLVVVAVMLATTLVASTAAAKTKPKPKKKSSAIAFVGSYSGKATTLVSGTTVAITANGSGSGTLIGSGTMTANGTGDTSQQPCVPFGGTGTITGAGGTIAFKASPGASGCGDEDGQNFTVKAYLAITSATGKLAKVKGTLRAVGTYSREDGSFQVKLTATLTK